MNNDAKILSELAAMKMEIQSLKQCVQVLTGMTRALLNEQIDASPFAINKDLDRYIDEDEEVLNTLNPDIVCRVLNTLHRAGIYTYRDLSLVSIEELSRIHNAGKVTIQAYEQLAQARGVTIPRTYTGLDLGLSVGEPAILRITPQNWQNPRGTKRAGDIVTVIEYNETKLNSYSYQFASYVCTDDDGNKLYLSPGQLACALNSKR